MEKDKSDINAETLICASLAYPNRKTVAPAMYNAGFRNKSINSRYVAFEPENIGEAMLAVRSLNLRGVSVSKPYKESVIPFLDEIDEVAKAIGAVNVVNNLNGKLIGYNSDWIGAMQSLEDQVALEGKRVAILGAGGASRAIIYGLVQKQAKVYLFNRTEEKGQNLSKEFNINWGVNLTDISNSNPEIIINTIPNFDVNLIKDSDKLFKSVNLVMDINVQNDKSQILIEAEANGAKTIDGKRMLVLQGAFTFKLFTGVEAPIDVMYSAVIEALKDK